MEKITIKREVSGWRPLILKGKSIRNIIFYRDGIIKYETKRGWLEHDNQDVLSITIDTPVRANKLNLNRKDNFYMTKNDYGETVFNLYIYINNIDIAISDSDEFVKIETEKEINYKLAYNLSIPCTVQAHRLNENKNLEYYESEQITGINIESPYYTRTVIKQLGQKIKNIRKKIDSVLTRHSITDYDIEKLLQIFDFVEKK